MPWTSDEDQRPTERRRPFGPAGNWMDAGRFWDASDADCQTCPTRPVSSTKVIEKFCLSSFPIDIKGQSAQHRVSVTNLHLSFDRDDSSGFLNTPTIKGFSGVGVICITLHVVPTIDVDAVAGVGHNLQPAIVWAYYSQQDETYGLLRRGKLYWLVDLTPALRESALRRNPNHSGSNHRLDTQAGDYSFLSVVAVRPPTFPRAVKCKQRALIVL